MTSTKKIIPLLLAGGAGTRLWPVSRDAMPKQFLPLVGERSTYQQALGRVSAADLFAPPIIMTANDFRFFARMQAEEIGIDATVVLEPLRRDSAPAIAAGARLALQRDPDAVVLALAADHVILDEEVFRAACSAACEAAAAGYIVTFGIPPSSPKTSYGYIRRGEPLGFDGCNIVDAFVEKPDAATAASYVSAGYLWNSGNFLFRAATLIDEVARFEPLMAQAVEAAVNRAKIDLGFVRLDAEAFASAPQKSIDYAVMEKTERAAVVESRFRWSDIGSWDAVFEVGAPDDRGNVVFGPVTTVDAQDCVIHAEERLTVALGVKNLVVVTTPDAVLVVPRARSEDVKGLVALLKERGRSEAVVHRCSYRPWGQYDSLDQGDRFQVKRIVVKPNAKLSLQRHYHRAEHWVVVRGTAEVTIGDTTHIVHENESIFIPIGTVHRLANPGRIPLEVIEVQTGSYLGEDDIVRLDDIYKRG